MQSIANEKKNQFSMLGLGAIYQSMMNMYRLFVVPDESLISDDYIAIMNNPKDKEEYLKAIGEASKERKDVSIQLSNGKTLIVGG